MFGVAVIVVYFRQKVSPPGSKVRHIVDKVDTLGWQNSVESSTVRGTTGDVEEVALGNNDRVASAGK